MWIFNDIRAEKRKGEVTLHIGKPCNFLNRPGSLNLSDRSGANQIGHVGGTTRALDERVEAYYALVQGNKDGEVVLADDAVKWRGYGAGIVLVKEDESVDGGFSLLSPYRDADAPGDRLVWGALSGATEERGESRNWLDLMLKEGVEEVLLTINGKLIVYNIRWDGVDLRRARYGQQNRIEKLTLAQARGVEIPETNRREVVTDLLGELEFWDYEILEIPLEIVPPKNAVRIIESQEKRKPLVFYATPVFETKFSGLELVTYGVIRDLPEGELRIWDGERKGPESFLHREVHEIFPDGSIIVHQRGRVVRRTSIDGVIDVREMHRASLMTDPKELRKIPPHTSTANFAALTKADALPWKIDHESPLNRIVFGVEKVPEILDRRIDDQGDSLEELVQRVIRRIESCHTGIPRKSCVTGDYDKNRETARIETEELQNLFKNLRETYAQRDDILTLVLKKFFVDDARQDPVRIVNHDRQVCQNGDDQLYERDAQSFERFFEFYIKLGGEGILSAPLDVVTDFMATEDFIAKGNVAHHHPALFSLFVKTRTYPDEYQLVRNMVGKDRFRMFGNGLCKMYDAMVGTELNEDERRRVLGWLYDTYGETSRIDVRLMGETFFDRKKKEDNEKTRATLDQLATCFEYQGKISKEKRNTISEVLGMTEITVPTHILVRKLGSGGSGDVYLAMKDHSKVPRKIKIFRRDELHPHIKAQRSRRDLIDIVQQESDVLAEISHPNVTRYFDHGVASDRRPYTVSEYVEGTTVEEALPTLSFAERAVIFYQLAEVMAFFHGLGYVIRDFKLNNAIWNPEKKVVKVTDLETIRKIEDEREEGNSTRGSNRYAAPEIMRGERATTKSDWYALGACLLYLQQGHAGGLEELNTLPEDQYKGQLCNIIFALPPLPSFSSFGGDIDIAFDAYEERKQLEDLFGGASDKASSALHVPLSRQFVLYSLLKYKPEDRFIFWLERSGIKGWRDTPRILKDHYHFEPVDLSQDPETFYPYET